MGLLVKAQLFKSESSKAMLALVAAGVMVLAILNFKNNNLGMDVVDILSRFGIIAPSWIVNAITAAGSVMAIIIILGSLGAGLPAAVLEQLAAASTAAA